MTLHKKPSFGLLPLTRALGTKSSQRASPLRLPAYLAFGHLPESLAPFGEKFYDGTLD